MCKSLEPHLCFLITGIRLKIHIEVCLLAIRVTWARLMRMRDFAMWGWGTLSHGELGKRFGTVLTKDPAFCQDPAFCYKILRFATRSCILLQDPVFGYKILRFASRSYVLLQDLAFCYKILRFATKGPAVRRVDGRINCKLTGHVYRVKAQTKDPVVCQDPAFCYKILHFAIRSCVLLQDLAFCYKRYCGLSKPVVCLSLRNRPPMLAPGRYPQWRSRFLRYVDTRPNGEALRKCILSDPYKPTTVFVHDVEGTDDSSAVPEHTTVKTPTNMSPENKAHFLAEKEAIHLILTGIGDDIYSTVDSFQMTQEMWEAIERLQQVWDSEDSERCWHKGKGRKSGSTEVWNSVL
nr:hypothetical protein [Tanacetum cinerariifolium]